MCIRIGPVEKLLREKAAKTTLHFTLIDPEKSSPTEAADLAYRMVEAGSDVILVGGSIGVSEHDIDEVIKAIKSKVRSPIILFPGNISGVSRYADAILFMSLLNSDDPYFITGAQLLGSVLVRKYGLEALPTAYIIIGEGGAAGFIGKARPVPEEKPEIAAVYALAASLMGMRFVYFEKGSGAKTPVPLEAIATAKKLTSKNVFLIVGGGIKSEDSAAKIAKAGADAIVTGTIVEKDPEIAKNIIKAIKIYGRKS